MNDVAEAIYVCGKENPKLKLKLISGNPPTMMEFDNCTCKLSDPKLIELADGFIETKPNIARLIRKVDRKAAEKVALEHQAKANLGGAHKGPLDSNALKQAASAMETRDEELRAASADPKAAAALSEQIREGDLQTTHAAQKVTGKGENATVTGEVARDSGEGFKPETPPATPAPATNANAGKILLGKK